MRRFTALALLTLVATACDGAGTEPEPNPPTEGRYTLARVEGPAPGSNYSGSLTLDGGTWQQAVTFTQGGAAQTANHQGTYIVDTSPVTGRTRVVFLSTPDRQMTVGLKEGREMVMQMGAHWFVWRHD